MELTGPVVSRLEYDGSPGTDVMTGSAEASSEDETGSELEVEEAGNGKPTPPPVPVEYSMLEPEK